jgi:hypothetical protein
MKISEKEYEVPDACPSNCPFKEELSKLGQSAICIRCPVFTCHPKDNALMPPKEYRPDWAETWHAFFNALSRNERPPIPQLHFTIDWTGHE